LAQGINGNTLPLLSAMASAILKKWFPEKGFGFLKPDDGSADVFAHSRQFNGTVEQVHDGMKISFTAEWDEKAGKQKAAAWQPLDGAGLAPLQAAPNAAAMAGLAGMAGMAGMMMPQYGMAAAGGFVDPRLAASPYGAMGLPGGLAGVMGGCPAAAAPMPPGWEQVSDPTTGRIYYCNKSTGESAWTPPAGAAAAPAAMPQMDPMAQQQMMAQMMAAQAAATAPAAAVAPQAAAAPAAGGALPPGWEVASDPSSGKQYYFNRSTGTTSWDVPTA